METKYIITINYYKDKTKQLEIVDWYNMGKYIAYRLKDGTIKETLSNRIIEIRLKE